MKNLERIKMKPLLLYKKDNGKIGIVSGHKKVQILKIMGVTELKPEMYNYNNGNYNKDILDMNDIDEKIV